MPELQKTLDAIEWYAAVKGMSYLRMESYVAINFESPDGEQSGVREISTVVDLACALTEFRIIQPRKMLR